MPAIVLTFVLLPLKLDFIGFYILERGVGIILDIAHWVTDLPHAVLLLPSWSSISLLSFVFAALIIFLFKTHIRVVSLLFLALSGYNIIIYKQPDILISSNFKLVGVRTEDGQFLVSTRSAERFARGNWERRFGMEEGSAERWPREYTEINGSPFACDEQACRMTFKSYAITYVKEPTAIDGECNNNADIILSPIPISSKDCTASTVIDIYDTRRTGAHALWLTQPDLIIQASEDFRGSRPWSKLNQDFLKPRTDETAAPNYKNASD